MEKTELHQDVGKVIRIICAECKNTTNHKVLASVTRSATMPTNVEDYDFWWEISYQIVQCQGCDTASFRSESSNSEDFDEDGAAYTVLLYPKRTKDTHAPQDFFNIPTLLRMVYRETVDCYNNGNYTLCAAGVRALVEGLCKENGIIDGPVERIKADGEVETVRRRDLQGLIYGLHDKGMLTKHSADMLHEHRFLGNTAIHELKMPRPTDLLLAMEIIEHVFQNIYEMPEKAMKLKSRL